MDTYILEIRSNKKKPKHEPLDFSVEALDKLEKIMKRNEEYAENGKQDETSRTYLHESV